MHEDENSSSLGHSSNQKGSKSQTERQGKGGKAKRKEFNRRNEPQSVLWKQKWDHEDDLEALQAFDFVSARAKEFSSMLWAVSNKGGAKRTFQKLPRHMRRRAMSFNVSRLPWREREMAATEVRVNIMC